MGLKSNLIRLYANKVSADIRRWSADAVNCQHRIREKLVLKAAKTNFGRDHSFHEIKTAQDFSDSVPIRDYEALAGYIAKIKEGERNVLWPGIPIYFAKTSGTTSGAKYIPLTKDSLSNHFGTARNALLHYYSTTGKGSFFDGKIIFLSGSPELEKTGDILTGRLSGIVNHQVPQWLKTNQLPSYTTNCIDDWEEKLDAIVKETIGQDMRLISGIPPWVQMYYERLLEKSGKSTIKKLFPNFDMFVYGGVNFEPYRSALERLVGQRIDSVETYPASEGFIAFQDKQGDSGLLINANSGIYFEFVPADEIYAEHPTRLHLGQVQMGVNYAIIINNNAGLWGYNIGDTVEFTSLQPFRIRVTGRVKHFISAFGEHVIGKEVEAALRQASAKIACSVVEFTVAPQVNTESGSKPYHEWFVEFDQFPNDPIKFAEELDKAMIEQNIYYQDLISGKILQPLVLTVLKKGAFREYMKSQGKLGGQNKVPRLSNDRKIADALLPFKQ